MYAIRSYYGAKDPVIVFRKGISDKRFTDFVGNKALISTFSMLSAITAEVITLT